MKPTVLVITSGGVGGVEKRLSEVWLHLAPKLAHLRMVVRRSTFEQLCRRPDLSGLARFRDRVMLVDTAATSFPATMAAFAPALWRLPKGSVVHHILQAPPLLHRLRGHRMLLSWVGTTYPRATSKLKDWAVSSMSLRSADCIDVLNPEVMALLDRNGSLSERLRLTVGGTIVDGDIFRPGEKRDLIVFLGRIERYKNALAFVEAIPLIHRQLTAAGIRAGFRIYGHSADQGEAVRKLLESDQYCALDVTWEQTNDPASVLAPAKLFVSLQSPSNYPSKALAEAMAAGCVPVITDSGESRRMADPRFARFIPEQFTPDQLADAVGEVMTLDAKAFAARSSAVREDALKRFAIGPQADYFAGLYAELGAG